MPSTIRDVALKAGVSPATVSKAMNGSGSVKSPVLVAESPKVVPESRIVIASEPFLQHILEEPKTSILIPNKNAHIVLT